MGDKMKTEDIEMEYNACKQLASAVLLTALEDAIKTKTTKFNYDISSFSKNKREAILFLTSTNGEFKRSREFWCAIAGINPENLVKSFHKWSGKYEEYKVFNKTSHHVRELICR